MKNGYYEFGYYGDYALRVNNELDKYELISYGYWIEEIQTLSISREKAELIFKKYNLSDKNLVKNK